MKRLPKEEALKKIREFFKDIENKSPKEVRKIKRLAMKHNIKLGELRKKFCKKCYSVFNSKNCEIRIKNKIKRVKCLNCGYVARWKLKK